MLMSQPVDICKINYLVNYLKEKTSFHTDRNCYVSKGLYILVNNNVICVHKFLCVYFLLIIFVNVLNCDLQCNSQEDKISSYSYWKKSKRHP